MRTRDNLLIDATVLTCCLLAASPAITGISAHEWISLAFGVTALVHLLLHREWLARAVTGLFGATPRRSRRHLVLDAVTGAAVATVMVSGVAVSQTLKSLTGLTWTAGAAWHTAHAVSAYGSLALAAVHLAVHWRWVVTAARLHVLAPLTAALRGGARPVAGTRAVAWGVPALLVAGLLTLAALGIGNATSTAYASTGTGTLTCPATGCTATTCHATGQATAGLPATGSTSGSTSTTTLTCPRTGCTATSCHATSGRRGGGGPGGFGSGS